MPFDVFISYASQDLKHAEEALARLTAEGFSVWFDRARLKPGFDWHREIEDACENSRVFVPVLTQAWKESPWTRYETYGAEAIIPLVVEDVWENVNTPPLERFQAQKLEAPAAGDVVWDALVDALRGMLAQPIPQRTKRLTRLKYRPNPYFVGREAELLSLHEALHCRPRAVLTHGRVRVISALGGVGKTTLARHYVEKFWRCYQQMFWVDPAIGLEREYARIHDSLFPEQIDMGAGIDEKAEKALLELSSQDTRLLILDNVDDEQSVQDWIPKAGGCHTLITSRFSRWSAAMEATRLEVLEPESSIRFLHRRTSHAAGTSEESRVLADRLGHLPLALEQAAAYIEQQGAGFGFTDYLRLYEGAERELLAADSLGSTEYPDSVVTTWKSTVSALAAPARALLLLLSFMAPTPLPIGALIGGSRHVRSLADRGKEQGRKPDHDEELWVRRAVESLAAYSMARFENQAISVHPLVQAVQRLETPAGERETFVEKCIQLIESGTPENVDLPQSWAVWKDLHPHALALLEHVENVDARLRIGLLDALARYEFGNGRYEASVEFERRAYDLAEASFGVDSRQTAGRLINYGESLRALGRYDEAEMLFKRSLTWQREHGTEPLDVATSCNYLGLLYRLQHRHDEARKYLGEGLEICRKAGIEGGRTLVKLLLNLGFLFLKAEPKRGEPYSLEALEIAEREFGEEDLLTLHACGMLGAARTNSGAPVEALPLMERAFRGVEEQLGEMHPETLNYLSTLATIRHRVGDLDACVELGRIAVDRCEKRFGSLHPKSAKAVSGLAAALIKTGEVTEGERLLRRALEIQRKMEKSEDEATADSSLALARLLFTKGDNSAAVSFYEDAYRIYKWNAQRVGQSDPLLCSILAECANQIAFHGRVPLRKWQEAEVYYREAMRLFAEAGQPVEAANAELNLQTMFQVSGQTVDRKRVEAVTRILEEAGDKRSSKAEALLG